MTIANVTAGTIIDPAWGNSVADALNNRVITWAINSADQTGITTAVDVTGLTATWTADASHLYRISAELSIGASAAPSIAAIYITDGASGSKVWRRTNVAASAQSELIATELVTGLSGSVTRKIRAIAQFGGSITVYGTGDQKGSLIVEDLGAA